VRRRWPWLVLSIGALTGAGVTLAALEPDSPARVIGSDASAPAMTVSTLPFDVIGAASAASSDGSVVTPAISSAGVASGQSAVAPASRPSAPVPATAGSLLLDAETVRGADIRVGIPAGMYADVFERALSIAPAHGGFVASSSSTFDEDASMGQLVLRVPVNEFDTARRAVAGLGQLEAETVRGQDVSAQLVDYDARLRSLEAQEEALRGLMGKATTVGEVLQIQPTLTGVRQQIEQFTAQRARLKDAAAMSTVLVTLREPDAPSAGRPDPTQSGLGQRTEQAVHGALAVVGGMIVALGWAAPVLALGTIGYVTVVLGRRLGRRA
jgi:hypothetical protein